MTPVDASLINGDPSAFLALGKPNPIPTEVNVFSEPPTYAAACDDVHALYRAYGRDNDGPGPDGDEAGQDYWCRVLYREGLAGHGFSATLRYLASELERIWQATNPGKG
jgi:hypothetical protein